MKGALSRVAVCLESSCCVSESVVLQYIMSLLRRGETSQERTAAAAAAVAAPYALELWVTGSFERRCSRRRRALRPGIAGGGFVQAPSLPPCCEHLLGLGLVSWTDRRTDPMDRSITDRNRYAVFFTFSTRFFTISLFWYQPILWWCCH